MRRRLLSFLMLSICLAGSAQAQPDDRFRSPRSNADGPRVNPQRLPKNPCAAFGPGFVRIEGSDTCVKIGGSVGVSVGAGSSGMTMPR